MANKPNILLIGAGKFGINHLRVLKELENEEKITLKGAVTATEESKKRIKNNFGIESYTLASLSDDLLQTIDAIDIATPASTHYNLAKKFISYSHLFVEKPVALHANQIKDLILSSEKNSKILMAGHIFRFNDAIDKLKEILTKNKDDIYFVEAKFTGPGIPCDCGAMHNFMHVFDIMNCLFGKLPEAVSCRTLHTSVSDHEYYANLILDYDKIFVKIELGWAGEKKERYIKLKFRSMTVFSDIVKQSINIAEGNTEQEVNCYSGEPLKRELEHFIGLINGSNQNYLIYQKYPNAMQALEVQKIIDAAKQSALEDKIIYFKP